MSTDRELLALAAKAAGMDVHESTDGTIQHPEAPSLPEPAFSLKWVSRLGAYYVDKPNIGDTDVYTADQMRTALAERDALQKVCDEQRESLADYLAMQCERDALRQELVALRSNYAHQSAELIAARTERTALVAELKSLQSAALVAYNSIDADSRREPEMIALARALEARIHGIGGDTPRWREGMSDTRSIVAGPCWTEHGLRCTSDTHRCQHFGVHDWHYTYCSAQTEEGQRYPWAGAGTQTLTSDCQRNGCPLGGITSATKEPK